MRKFILTAALTAAVVLLILPSVSQLLLAIMDGLLDFSVEYAEVLGLVAALAVILMALAAILLGSKKRGVEP